MLICHKLVVSNGAAVLQACHMSESQQTCMQHWQCRSCQRRERLCAGERLVQSYLSLLVSQTTSLSSDASPPPLRDTVVIPMKTACLQSEKLLFYIYIFIFLLYAFGIVFNCIIQNNSYCLH